MNIRHVKSKNFETIRIGDRKILTRSGYVLYFPIPGNIYGRRTPSSENTEDGGDGGGDLISVDEIEFDNVGNNNAVYLKIRWQSQVNYDRAIASVIGPDHPIPDPYDPLEYFMQIPYRIFINPTFEYVLNDDSLGPLANEYADNVYIQYIKISEITILDDVFRIKNRHKNLIFLPRIRHYFTNASLD